jgi:hypothetical protein
MADRSREELLVLFCSIVYTYIGIPFSSTLGSRKS